MKNVKQKFRGCRREAMLTVLAILLSCLPVGKASALGDGEYFVYTVPTSVNPSCQYSLGLTVVSEADKTAKVTVVGGDAYNNSIVIPATVTYADNTYTVVAFEADCLTISGITLPTASTFQSIIMMKGGGFTSLHIPANVTNVAAGAFTSMTYLNEITVDDSNPNYTAEGGVLYKKNGANRELLCYPLKKTGDSFTVPSDVTKIYWKSFQNNINLTTLNLPAGLTAIEGYDVNNQPKTDNELFTGCANLAAVNMPTANSTFKSDNGVLYVCEDGNWKLMFYPYKKMDTSYTILSDATTVLWHAFDGSQFSTVNLGSVTTLPEEAFFNCQGLTRVEIPSTLTDISGAFRQCDYISWFEVDSSNPDLISIYGVVFNKALTIVKAIPPTITEYTIPSSITTIGSNAFKNTKLTKLTVPSSVQTIEEYAFADMGLLEEIVFNEGVRIGGTTPTVLPKFCFLRCEKLKTVTNLPSNITKIGNNAFEWTAVEDISFLEGLTSLTEVGEYAFWNCKNLEEADFRNTTITTISNGAFADCDNLETLIFREGITTLGQAAFARCVSIKEMELPSTINGIEMWCFLNCTGLENVTVKSGASGVIDNESFKGCTSLKTFTMTGTNFTAIGTDAFWNCYSLESISIPNSVENIYPRAFQYCTSLNEANFDLENSNLTTIHENAFEYSGLSGTLTLPEKLTTIKQEAFGACFGLTEVNIPASTTSIDPLAFRYCTDVMAFNVDAGNTVYSSGDGVLMSKDKRKLVLYPPGQTVNGFQLLPPSLTEIGDYAFYECDKMETVVIPKRVKKIGKRAFGLTTNLKHVYFLGDEILGDECFNRTANETTFDESGVVASESPYYKATPHTMTNITMHFRNRAVANATSNNVIEIPTYYSLFNSDIYTSTSIANDKGELEDYFTFKNADNENCAILLQTTNTNHTFIVPKQIATSNSAKCMHYRLNSGQQYNAYSNSEPVIHNVTHIGDYAFEGASSDIKEVIVFHQPEYVGAAAFLTDVSTNIDLESDFQDKSNKYSINRVFFIGNEPDKTTLGSKRFELGDGTSEILRNYNEFGSLQKVYVKKSVKAAYLEKWNVGSRYNSVIDYKIKPSLDNSISELDLTGDKDAPNKYDFITIAAGKKYATFSREFDVDLGEYAREKEDESFDIKAFTTGVLRGGSGRPQDYPEEGNDHNAPYHLKMYHIGYDSDAADAKEYNKGTYVPNNTGVLLAVMKDWNGTPSDYFYCIGEDDKGGTRNADNTGNGTLRKSVEAGLYKLPAITAVGGKYHPTQWVMQGGVFRPVKGTDVYLPAHKAWLYLDMEVLASDADTSASAIAFSFSLDSFSEDTGVDAPDLTTATTADGIYTLTGVKVLKPEGKGIYIVNGKKMVIK